MIEEKDMLRITVQIAGRPYPLKVKASDEAAVREVIKELNDKINKFQVMYIQKDRQDCLAMTLLTYAVDFHRMRQLQTEAIDTTILSDKITAIEYILEGLGRRSDD
jgi:cell division protein ZapA (FtsZ GTPase activity inhibitor)